MDSRHSPHPSEDAIGQQHTGVPKTGYEFSLPIRGVGISRPKLGVKPYRSTQIGIGRGLSQKCAEERIKSIKDVTEMAGRLRELVENAKGEGKEEMSECGGISRKRNHACGEGALGAGGVEEGVERLMNDDCLGVLVKRYGLSG
jgi:hypothetical protein